MNGEDPIIESTTLDYPDAEVVFGIVCAVGTDYRPVVDYLRNLLQRAHYRAHELRVSEFFPEIAENLGLEFEVPTTDVEVATANEYKRISSGMKIGNAIREKTQNPGFLALDIASRILSSRPKSDSDAPDALPRTAHIVISLKRREEVEILRRIYGHGFFLIGIFASEQQRRNYLEVEKGIYGPCLDEVIGRDQKEEDVPLGQRTRDTFEHADIFVDVKNGQYKEGILRFLQLVFGYPYATPTRDEYGMFLAYSASARSGALARQVGAAIMSERGDLLALGCNDVPAPGGGLYWEGDVDDYREHKLGGDPNEQQKREMVNAAVGKFEELVVPGPQSDKLIKALSTAVSDAISNITEFGRSVHAEMDAITTCARIGVAISSATLFATTFPCHNCTRHLIAAGIKRVVYIEPYPKSKAGILHGDAICLAHCDEAGNVRKIPFEPFVGIGPKRFFDLFSLKLSAGYEVERKSQGQVIDWRLETHAKPRVPMPPTSYIEREQYVFRALVATYKEKGPKYGGPRTAGKERSGVPDAYGEHSSPGRKVASMEDGREIQSHERTGTDDLQPGKLFK